MEYSLLLAQSGLALDLAVLALTAIGLVVIYSASHSRLRQSEPLALCPNAAD